MCIILYRMRNIALVSAMLGSCVCALVRDLVTGGSGLASRSSRLDSGVLGGS